MIIVDKFLKVQLKKGFLWNIENVVMIMIQHW